MGLFFGIQQTEKKLKQNTECFYSNHTRAQLTCLVMCAMRASTALFAKKRNSRSTTAQRNTSKAQLQTKTSSQFSLFLLLARGHVLSKKNNPKTAVEPEGSDHMLSVMHRRKEQSVTVYSHFEEMMMMMGAYLVSSSFDWSDLLFIILQLYYYYSSINVRAHIYLSVWHYKVNNRCV